MSDSLSLPKVKLVSPGKKKAYYEKILSGTPPFKINNSKNKLKNIQIKKKNTTTNTNKNNSNLTIDNMQTTEAICNIIDLINDNNLKIFYKEDSSNFKRNIDQLNLKFYLETEKIISSNNQSKTKEENISFNSNKLFLILFKQINLYIKEIERLNALMINNVKDVDNMKKKMAIFIRKQDDFETKEQIIKTLKYSVSSLEKKLSNVLISENNLRQEIQKIKKEKDYYYDYYKNNVNLNANKIQNIKDIKQNNNTNNNNTNGNSNSNNQHLKHNTKDIFFNNNQNTILLNDRPKTSAFNDHKRNNSENDFPSKNNDNYKNMAGNLQKYCDRSPKRKNKNNKNSQNNGNNSINNNITGTKSIIRLCNYYSHNIEIDIPLGFKSKSPGKSFRTNKIKESMTKIGKNGENQNFQKSSVINENKLDLNIVNNNNNTFIFENSFVNRNKTIYNTINQNKDLSINRLFKNRTNIDKNNDEEKIKNNKVNSAIINKDSIKSSSKDFEIDEDNLNNLENLLIEVKEYILNNENKSNKDNNKDNNNISKINNKNKNNPKNKSNSIVNNNNKKK